jgi:hypothetical protein
LLTIKVNRPVDPLLPAVYVTVRECDPDVMDHPDPASDQL